jgi:hypothetical protein
MSLILAHEDGISTAGALAATGGGQDGTSKPDFFHSW